MVLALLSSHSLAHSQVSPSQAAYMSESFPVEVAAVVIME